MGKYNNYVTVCSTPDCHMLATSMLHVVELAVAIQDHIRLLRQLLYFFNVMFLL